jgi:cyclic-di-AMP phosphodiesterase
VETSASSVSELATELLPYQTNKVNISESEATIMYNGILVDTNRFRMRTGSRTFEAVAYLKKIGADSMKAENMLKEDYDDFEAKTSIMNWSEKYRGNMIIAAVNDNTIEDRTMMSQAADSLLNIKGIEASFVIANIKDNKVAVSARSKGEINVQVIMEKMHGGGHFSAAALQRDDTSVAAVDDELRAMIDEYIEENKEDTTDESNTTK